MMFLRTAALLMLLTVIGHAQKDPTASDGWASAPVSGSVAVYATINNPTMYDVYVVSGTSESAGKVELINVDKVITSITVAAYGSAELKAGEMFVRLSALKGEIKAGDTVKLTLTTDGGIAIPLAAVVK
jgi:copper(I)-binding protein